jgi:hypothetical protein
MNICRSNKAVHPGAQAKKQVTSRAIHVNVIERLISLGMEDVTIENGLHDITVECANNLIRELHSFAENCAGDPAVRRVFKYEIGQYSHKLGELPQSNLYYNSSQVKYEIDRILDFAQKGFDL